MNGQERGGENDRRNRVPERDARYLLMHLDESHYYEHILIIYDGRLNEDIPRNQIVIVVHHPQSVVQFAFK